MRKWVKRAETLYPDPKSRAWNGLSPLGLSRPLQAAISNLFDNHFLGSNMKTRKAKKPNEAKKAAKAAETEEIDVGEAKSPELEGGRGKSCYFIIVNKNPKYL